MNNYTLIKLTDKFILVSDEEIKLMDFIIDIKNPLSIKQVKTQHLLEDLFDTEKKVISEKPDFSLLSEEDCKRIGYVDVEKLANIAFKNRLIETNQDISWVGYGKGVDGVEKSRWVNIWIKGFKTAQSLNDKMFSLEDIMKAIEMARETEHFNGLFPLKYTPSSVVKSLQQTSWEVEVEMEGCSDCHLNEGYMSSPNCCRQLRPKITNNSIKVIKIC